MDVRLVDQRWGAELGALAESHPAPLRIICPFIKQDALWRIVGDELPADTRVITRFSLTDFSSGVTDIVALRDVLDAGGEVRGICGLHSKVFVFGGHTAVVTSANLTHRALTWNQEFGCVSDVPDFVAACSAYFNQLWNIGSSVTAAQLAEWEAEVADFLRGGVPGGRRVGLPDHGASASASADSAPLVPAPSLPNTADTQPPWLSEAAHGHVKFFGQGDDRMPWSMPVIEEVDGSGSHWACTYPAGSRPRQVQDGDVMYLARMVESPDDHLIFGRAVGLRHVDERDDATEADIARRPWKVQWPHYVRVHDAEFVAGIISNGIPLSRLMDELGSDAFASTQEHAASGEGNTNPRMALRQQAAVRLSAQGLAWMNAQFDAALALHGRLPADELASLDWPDTDTLRAAAA